MFHRKSSSGGYFAPISKVYEKRSKSETVFENGHVRVDMHFEDVDITDPEILKTMPTPDEFTLANCKKAGMNLDSLSSTVLTPDSVESNNAIAESILNDIDNYNKEEK